MEEDGGVHNGMLTRRRSTKTADDSSRVTRRSSSTYLAAKSSLPSVLIGFSTSTLHQNFQPVSDEIPPSLLCIRQVPLLLYSVDFLIRNGATEIFLLLKDDSEGAEISKVVEEHRASLGRRLHHFVDSLDIRPVWLSPSVRTLGDALRELDTKVQFQQDFLLMHACTVAVGDIRKAVSAHKSRRLLFHSASSSSSSSSSTSLPLSQERNEYKARGVFRREPLLTQVLMQAPPTSLSRHVDDDVLFVLNRDTNEIIEHRPMYDSGGREDGTRRRKSLRALRLSQEVLFFPSVSVPVTSDSSSSSSLSPSLLDAEVSVHYDLVDSGVYICSPKVLTLFAYSFDLTSIQNDLIPAVVNRRIQLHAIHAHLLKVDSLLPNFSPYAARIEDFRSYMNVYFTFLERWMYPVVPENLAKLMKGGGSLTYVGHGLYQGENVKKSDRCELGPLALIDEGTSIHDEASIRHSIVGCRCSIGKGVVIENSLLLDDVVVEDHAIIRSSFISHKCHIKRNAELQRGCVLGQSVVVGEGVSVSPYKRFYAADTQMTLHARDHENTMTKKKDGKSREDLSSVPGGERGRSDSSDHHALLGSEGNGALWKIQSFSSREDEKRRTRDEWLRQTSPGGSIAEFIHLPLPLWRTRTSRVVDQDEEDEEDTRRAFALDRGMGSRNGVNQSRSSSKLHTLSSSPSSSSLSSPLFRSLSSSSYAFFSEFLEPPGEEGKSEWIDEELLQSCLKALQCTSIQERNSHLKMMKKTLLSSSSPSSSSPASSSSISVEKRRTYVVRHALRGLLLMLSSLGVPTKEKWRSFVEEHHVESYLLASLPQDITPKELAPLWYDCLRYFQYFSSSFSSFFSNRDHEKFFIFLNEKERQEEAKKNPTKEQQEDEEEEYKKLKERIDQFQDQVQTPQGGASTFFFFVEIMCTYDFLESRKSLPLWYMQFKAVHKVLKESLLSDQEKQDPKTMTSGGKKKEGEGERDKKLSLIEKDQFYLKNPRLVAMCEWLQHEEKDEKEEEEN